MPRVTRGTKGRRRRKRILSMAKGFVGGRSLYRAGRETLDIADPDGIEGTPGSTPGLGLLDVSTTLGPVKQLRVEDAVHLRQRGGQGLG